jgi:transcriptional regulator with XRE-family HTH domain
LVFVTIRVTTGEKSMDEAEQSGQLPAFEDISSDTNIRPTIDRASKALQKLNSARRRQGLSIRCVAQRLGRTVSEVRAQEDERADMLVSELYRWQAALEVPIEELLEEPEDSLSTMVSVRAQLLKVMKTAMAMRRQARSEGERRLARLLTEQLLEIMPELKEVSGWPAVGHRRRADEVGRIGENPISEDWLHEAS